MWLSFLYPTALFLLLLIPLVWVWGVFAHAGEMVQRGRSISLLEAIRKHIPLRGWLSLAVRGVLLVVLVLALAGTQLVRPVEHQAVVFLVDGSDSVTPAQREWAVQYINDALATRAPEDEAGVVLFGKNALVERTPSQVDILNRLISTPKGDRTNIAEAIQLGLALFPADRKKRLVLLSDGRENEGKAREAAQLASARNIPLDVVPLPMESGADVLVHMLDAPDTARIGQVVALQAHIQSSIATSGQLQVFADDTLLTTKEVDIPAGNTTFPINVTINDTGFHRYEVRLEAKGDTRGVNNRGAAFTMVQGPPQVMLIASDPTRAESLQQALQATNVQITVVSPDRVPANQELLQAYDAVVLVDVMARDMPPAVIDALPVYVREQGGGLAMIGGRESFGAGGWRRSPLAEVLPVALDRKDTMSRPDIGLVLVIDRSGSMSQNSGNGRTRLDLAKEAVFQASLGLEQHDEIGIVTFDVAADWVLPVQPLPEVVDIELALSQFAADGGTDIRSGIAPAAQALATLDARVKHVILLTDGQAASNYADLIQQMQQQGTTITVVSIGQDANPALRQIAELGGGRFYRVNTIADVPRVFLSETILVIGRDIVEETFVPMVALPAPVVRGIDRIPPLYGYNATEPRQTARTILVSPDGKPILAQWQYGLGRSVAWTSDMKGQWAQDWVSWEQFPQFANGLLDMLLPPEQTEGLALDSRTEGDRVILDLTVPTTQQTRQGVHVLGRLLDPQDEGMDLTFDQIAADRYRAAVPVDTAGVYLAQVAVLDSDKQSLGNLSGGMVVAYSPEYSTQGSNPQLLQEMAQVTGGQDTPDPATVFAPLDQSVGVVQEVSIPLLWVALVLLPLDIAVRRLRVQWADMLALQAYIGRLFHREKPAEEPATPDERMARLRAAKERARKRE